MINSKQKKKIGFKKFLYALRGFYTALKEEISLVIHVIISVLVIGVGVFLYKQMTSLDWCIIVILISVIISSELVNTAIENIVDTSKFEYNYNIQKIKDIAAASTLILTISSIIVGLIIFIPKIIQLFN